MDSPDRRRHWDRVFTEKAPNRVTWYQRHLQRSLELIELAGPDESAAIVDVGGGVSTLVDDLLDRGFRDLTVIDVAPAALDASKKRLGSRGAGVAWIEGDITALSLPADRYDLWHDRAVFHFLTERDHRRAYAEALAGSLRPGGHAIFSTFALTGPPRCSGLPVVRYDPATLLDELGSGFVLVTARDESHVAPSGKRQDFVYCLFRKLS